MVLPEYAHRCCMPSQMGDTAIEEVTDCILLQTLRRRLRVCGRSVTQNQRLGAGR